MAQDQPNLPAERHRLPQVLPEGAGRSARSSFADVSTLRPCGVRFCPSPLECRDNLLLVEAEEPFLIGPDLMEVHMVVTGALVLTQATDVGL